MAYAAVVSLAQTIDQIPYHDQYSPISLTAAKQEIISIRGHAIFLQAFLQDFPEKSTSWEGRITDAAYKAEDIIEYFVLESCGSTVVAPSKAKFRRQLRKVAEKLKSIVGEVIEIKNGVESEDARRVSDSPAASLSSRFSPSEKEMIGRHDDLMAIMYRLTGHQHMLQIVPIVGMGGVGKTILARNVYDDPFVIYHFDVRAWVTASRDYSLEDILWSLLLSMGLPTEKIISRQRDELIREVYRRLNGSTYLIVMDDVWSTKIWDDVKMVFPDDRSGSRIVLTTRLSDVAAYVDSSFPPHEMGLMDADQSWNLLQRKVFRHEACPDELEDIGKEIARRCRGLPLSIVIVAELLSRISKTRASWEAIAEDVISALATKDGQFEKMLFLSYTQLPHHLRSCLLYMGGFAQDYEIQVSELIKLWVAEGFVKSNGSKTFEEVAEQYLNDLVDRSLVLVTGRKSNGKIKSCSLHDVVRDFCIRKVQEEKFLLPVMDYLPGTTLRRYFLPRILKNQRRICVNSYDLNLKEPICNSPVRTIICMLQGGYQSMGSVQNFNLLRVLHVVRKNDDWDWDPGEVFELIRLKYFAAKIRFIPAAISKLQNLQTLIIYRSEVCLPVEIWRLGRLRHLVAFSFHPLPDPEGASFPLENLQTLLLATNLVCSERILKMIPNLKKFGICYSEDKFDQGYHLDNLQRLHQLEKLKLEIRGDFPLGQNLNPVFPRSLKKLTLSGTRIPWEDIVIIGSLPYLEVLKLRDFAFQGDEWAMVEGEFVSLKYLLIDKSDLQYWRIGSRDFPRLECLLLYRCPYLRWIPSGIGCIPSLQFIEVDGENESLLSSAKWIQEEQEELGNVQLQIRVKRS